MLMSIVSHTPVWVWLVLAYLLLTGYCGLSERPFKGPKILILPILFLLLSIQSLHFESINVFVLVVSLAFGCVVGMTLFRRQIQSMYVIGDSIYLPGSVNLLLLMLFAFSSHYVLSVMSILEPANQWDLMRIAVGGISSGAFSYRAITGLNQFRRLCLYHRSCEPQ